MKPIPPNATLAEGVRSIMRGKSVEKLRASDVKLRRASDADVQAAKQALTSKRIEIEPIVAAGARAHIGLGGGPDRSDIAIKGSTIQKRARKMIP